MSEYVAAPAIGNGGSIEYINDKVPVRLTKSLKMRPSNLANKKTNFFANLFSLRSQAEATEKINK